MSYRMHSLTRRQVTIAVTSMALAGSFALSACTREAFQSLDVTGAGFGRDFRLADQDGRVRTLQEFRGQVVLIFFGFTQCPDVCPTALARAADALGRLGTDAQRIQVIFVTIDPERDAPAMLREYTRAFLSCELKLFLPQLSASEGEAANRLDLETTLLQSQLN